MKPQSVSHPLQTKPGHSFILSEPKGVILNLCPWNYPISLAFHPAINMIAAGNCVVIKPIVTPNCSRLIKSLIERYLDTTCIRVVEGAVPETTALLRERWDHIMYTGNGAVARIVYAAAAKHLTPVTLELGGKSPVVIDKDCNVKVAAQRIVGAKFFNNGQTCVAPDYVLVERDIEDQFLQECSDVLLKSYGADAKSSKDLGRIVNGRHFERVAGLLRDNHGGKIVTGGLNGTEDKSDRYIPPTIVQRPRIDSRVMKEEIFGPVLPVVPVKDADEAIEFINGREKPLALYIFSERQAYQDKILASTSAGGTCVNDCIMHLTNPHLPFGGVGTSGFGAYHGKAGFDEFSHNRAQSWSGERGSTLTASARFPPYNDANVEKMKTFIFGPLISPAMKKILFGTGILAAAMVLKSRL